MLSCALFAANSATYNKVIESIEIQKKADLDFVKQNADVLRDVNEYVAYRIYQEQKIGSIVPVLINSTVGLGIGSFVQGDNKGGWIGLGCDVVGTALTAIGSSMMMSASMPDYGYPGNSSPDSSYPYSTSSSEMHNEYDQASYNTGVTLAIAGAITLGISRIYQMIRPITYANSYN